MNLKQGKIGGQEAICLGAAAACMSSIFTPDSEILYAQGNSAYISMLLSAALALAVFIVAARAMRTVKVNNLWELLRRGLGPVLSRVAAVLYALLLVFMAAALLSRFTLMLGRFVFPMAQEWQLLLYLLAAACVPAWMGLEGLGRTARLLAWVFFAALAGALLLAAYNYEPHRLAPFLGDGTLHLAELSARGITLFLPALLGLLIAGSGIHGAKHARRAGYAAGIISGALASLSQLCMGMTYTYKDLAEMHSPMYRLTMGFKTGGYFPRLDTLLLFGWAMTGMLASGFYIYIGALLFAQAFAQKDIRPAVAVFSGCVGAVALLLHLPAGFMSGILAFWSRFGFLLAATPVLLAAWIAQAARGREKRRKEREKEEELEEEPA